MINRETFDTAKSALRIELINDPDFALLSVDDTAFYSGIALMEEHNLNATDSALLSLFQSFIKTLTHADEVVFLLVAADERLVRTARAIGIKAINPEELTSEKVAAFLAAL